MEIRNIAIIAHVDHGKTTLTDALMRQTGVAGEGVSMDSNALEKERGITIYSKNTSVFYPKPDNPAGRAPTKINIVDTPGHADFGSEVERVLRSVDSVLLVVDAQEGPMPQTRFVLKKSLELGLRPIVVINKIDKPAADPKRVESEVFDLFVELGASESQADFPIIYCVSREGIAKKHLEDESKDLSPLLDMVLEKVPVASTKAEESLTLQVFNLGYDNFLGRLAVARIYSGVLRSDKVIIIKGHDKNTKLGKLTKLYTFEGLTRKEVVEANCGDIVMFAGFPDIYIGDTGVDIFETEMLPSIAIDEPTVVLNFLVNNSPFAGREGKFVTSRQIRERLEKELEINVGLRIDFSESDRYKVSGRGELHVAILLENMRREGFELQVSQPQAIIKEKDGQKHEPFEEATIDVPSEFQGAVIEKLGLRGFTIREMKEDNGVTRMILEGPTRGLLGYRGQFLIDTRGEGILCSRFLEFRPYIGEIRKRLVGSMISMEKGKATGYSLWNLQERGVLYIPANVEVYEGMVIGNTSKGEEMSVNPVKGKQLTNFRQTGSDEHINLVPPFLLSIERGLELMADDEFLEITPSNVRLRKQFLTDIDRARAKRQGN